MPILFLLLFLFLFAQYFLLINSWEISKFVKTSSNFTKIAKTKYTAKALSTHQPNFPPVS